jgi:hypothetical protein
LHERQAFGSEREHAALGDVQDLLTVPDAMGPLKVTCWTDSTNFRCPPSRAMRTRPFSIDTSRPPAVSVPANTSLRAFWLMLMNPPAPASRARIG